MHACADNSARLTWRPVRRSRPLASSSPSLSFDPVARAARDEKNMHDRVIEVIQNFANLSVRPALATPVSQSATGRRQQTTLTLASGKRPDWFRAKSGFWHEERT